MAKIKLGTRPKSFVRIVKFKDLDGVDMTAPVTYKYRTRKEYGAFHDSLPEYPHTIEPETDADGKTVYRAEALIEKRSEWNANHIMQILDGWALDEEFNFANVKQLCDELPGGAEAIISEYRGACVEGRMGN
jgi:hypothetical protein